MSEKYWKDAITAADEVQRFIGNEEVAKAFDHLEKVFLEAALATPDSPKCDDLRRIRLQAVHVLRFVQRQLQHVVNGGKIGADRLKSLDELAARKPQPGKVRSMFGI